MKKVWLILSLILLTAPAAAEPLVSVAPWVIDGDTLEFHGTKVRLWGIDAPEHDTALGRTATLLLVDLVDAGGGVSCEPVDTDTYGRIVAVCRDRVFESDIGFGLLLLGLADLALNDRQPAAKRNEYRRALAIAKREKRGLWK